MLPGEELINEGIHDLTKGRESIAALLVAIGAPRLRRSGHKLPLDLPASPEHRLYEKLRASGPDSSHSKYNALIRRLVSYERAVECAT